MANGDKLHCLGRADHVTISITGERFNISCYSIDLGDYDIVIGVAFLRTLRPILWDHNGLCMAFGRIGQQVHCKGVSSPCYATTFIALHTILLEPRPLLDDLLAIFEDVFAMPSGLPCDHRIHLQPGTTPVAIRPYRYPQVHKDELEYIVIDMLV